MWLHELEWEPREDERYFDVAKFTDKWGHVWCLEKPVNTRHGSWAMYQMSDPNWFSKRLFKYAYGGELEAQALLLDLTGKLPAEVTEETT